jgi:peptidoglycan/LPS O-acetylase OafA/YrhL
MMPPDPTARREFDIDAFRGLVCLSLATLHFYYVGLNEAFLSLFGPTGEHVVWNWRLGVESFFVLAGFMMAHMLRPVPGEGVSLTAYLKRRFFRLIIPFWAAVLIAGLDRWAVRLVFHRGDAPSLGDVAAQMLMLPEFVNAPSAAVGYWSMVTLEQFYLVWLAVYSVCLACFGRGNRDGTYGPAERVMVGLTFAACLASIAFYATGTEPVFKLPRYAGFLTLGMLLYWAARQNVAPAAFLIAVAGVMAAAVLTGYSRLFAALVTCAIFLPLARGFRVPDNALVRGLAFCGKRAYSIYLVHAVVGMRFLSIARRLAAGREWLAVPLLFAALVLSVLAAIIFYRYVERPFQERARRVEYRRPAERPAPEPGPVAVTV